MTWKKGEDGVVEEEKLHRAKILYLKGNTDSCPHCRKGGRFRGGGACCVQ